MQQRNSDSFFCVCFACLLSCSVVDDFPICGRHAILKCIHSFPCEGNRADQKLLLLYHTLRGRYRGTEHNHNGETHMCPLAQYYRVNLVWSASLSTCTYVFRFPLRVVPIPFDLIPALRRVRREASVRPSRSATPSRTRNHSAWKPHVPVGSGEWPGSRNFPRRFWAVGTDRQDGVGAAGHGNAVALAGLCVLLFLCVSSGKVTL